MAINGSVAVDESLTPDKLIGSLPYTEDGEVKQAQRMVPGHPDILTKTLTSPAVDGARTDLELVAATAGYRTAVTRIVIHVGGNTSGLVDCRIGFGSSVPTPANTSVSNLLVDVYGLGARDMIKDDSGGGAIAIGPTNTALKGTWSVPTGGHITISTTYYLIQGV